MFTLISLYQEDDCCGGDFYPDQVFLFSSATIAEEFIGAKKEEWYKEGRRWNTELIQVEDWPKEKTVGK